MSRNDRPRLRLIVDADLVPGADIALDRDRAHYLGSVMRGRVGEAVALINGRDGEARAKIARLDKKSATLTVTALDRPFTPAPDVWLCPAPVKRAGLELTVQKAAELGARRWQPVVTERTQGKKLNMARLETIAREAAEQCERLDPMTLADPVPLAELAAAWPAERVALVGDEDGTAPPAATVLADLVGRPAALLIGPEGGWSARDRAVLDTVPTLRRVGLGPRILRAETAAIALLTLWQSICGDARPGAP